MINAYLTDKAILYRSNGVDRWGEPLPDTEINIACRINEEMRLIKDIKGEDVYATSVIMQNRAISHEDFIEIDSKKHAIVLIKKPKNFGWNFIEVFIK